MARATKLANLPQVSLDLWKYLSEHQTFEFEAASVEEAKVARSQVYILSTSMKTYGTDEDRKRTLSVSLSGKTVTVSMNPLISALSTRLNMEIDIKALDHWVAQQPGVVEGEPLPARLAIERERRYFLLLEKHNLPY